MRLGIRCEKLTGICLCVLGVLCVFPAVARAQVQMPDPKQMSGIPRPVTDLPNGTVSVRLIRGELSNNIQNFPVELRVGSQVRTAKTDEAGRAEFSSLPFGARLKAVAVVDGERLESEEFSAPTQGGIRLLLVATDTSKGPATEPGAAAISGQVVIGGQTRIIVQPGDESLEIYYLLDIANNARVPVNPPTDFTFDMPKGATGTAILEGSSPNASVKDGRVTVKGPFAPGRTLVQVGAVLSAGDASVQITQRFPAMLEQLAIVVKKVGETTLASPQIATQQEMTASGDAYIAGTGGSVAAGQQIQFTLDNLPHHSPLPRVIALSLAGIIVVVGVWMCRRPDDTGSLAAERKRLASRRDKLFNDLVKLEHDSRSGKVGATRYGSRREEIVTALEHIYGALDSDDHGPEPVDRAA
jgi:hypothetical protein